MNMSDDVTSTTLQVSEKIVSATAHAATSIIDTIGKLLRELALMSRENRQQNMNQPVKSSDLTNIHAGAVSLKELYENARKTGDSITTSEQGLTKADMKAIAKKAKEYGIPVAFTKADGKDNYYANIRTGDLEAFKRICTDHLKDKLANHPQELGNFKCQKWEIPFLRAELNHFDLAADFAQTKDGGYFCMYNQSDTKAIMIARNEFLRKCTEIEKEISIQRDENGFFAIKDLRSGQEITFDSLPNREILSQQLQDQFGFDKNKADITCAKFGEEQLVGAEKEMYFSNDAQTAFSEIKGNVFLEDEHILTKGYDCYRLTPKADGVPCIVFQNKDGAFAVLHPEKQTRNQMRQILAAELGITDKTELNALIDKAEKVSYFFATQNQDIYSHEIEFTKENFDMSDPKTVENMRRTDPDGTVYTKTVPISSASTQIERSDKEHFAVNCSFTTVENDQNGKEYTNSTSTTLVLSFSNKRATLQQLKELYMQQGIPEYAAKQMAKEVFQKAEMQSASKVLHIEEVKADHAKITHGNTTVEISHTNREELIGSLKEEFHVSEEEATAVADKVDELVMPDLDETQLETNDVELSEIDQHQVSQMDSMDEFGENVSLDSLGGNGHEQHPEANILAPVGDNAAPDFDNMPDPPSIGGRR